MFHAISLTGYKFSISSNRFMEFINLTEKELKSGKSILTFDDGYDSIYHHAFPILKEKNIPFTCFLVVDYIDTDGYLSSKQIKEMLKSGLLIIQSHGLTHELLSKLDVEHINNEISKSKQTLEEKFGVNIDSFAYSHGVYTKDVIKALKDSGYKKAFIATSGIKDILFKNRYTNPRINIYDQTYDELMKVYYEKE